jgi:hypothetical protein
VTPQKREVPVVPIPRLVCALCLYVRSEEATGAITVLKGYAVCSEHMGLVAQGLDWHGVLKAAMEQEEES